MEAPKEIVLEPIVIDELVKSALPIVACAVKADVPLPLINPVSVVAPVPPDDTGNVPLTCVVRPILPHDGAKPTPPEISAFPVAISFKRARVLDVSA